MQVKIMANTYELTSSIKVDEIEALKKRNPAALKVTDKDGNDKFAISYEKGKGSVTQFGLTFGAKSRNNEGKAVLVGTIPANIESDEAAKDYVEELLHVAAGYLAELEATIPEAARAVEAAKNTFKGQISIA